MKFRSKPNVIDAEQFLHGATAPRGVHSDEDGRSYVITAHEQKVFVVPGDWIIAEPGSEKRFYPCKPEIFAARYEPG